MSFRKFLDRQQPHFEPGGKFQKLGAVYEMVDTFLYTPGKVTSEASHVRDGMDLKRMMSIVILALGPCIFFALYNTGLQANYAMEKAGTAFIAGWEGQILSFLGCGFNPFSFWDNLVHGAFYFIPVLIVTYGVGGFWEVIFASVRGHEINEGFLVTGMLFPLIMPPLIPLWQVALGVTFGVVIAKEIFGGVGMNFLNPALAGRAFLFFAYPAQISGDAVWVAVDGISAATPLGVAALGGVDAVEQLVSFSDAFLGFIPGSMGETSTLACLFGAAVLSFTGIGSWRVMLSVLLSALSLVFLFNMFDGGINPMFSVTPAWHLVLGGFAFGLVFMATDPVSGSMTQTGQWIYGALIGLLVMLVRVVNPAFPEGMMLAILFGNVFAPVIDHFVVKANIKRRGCRNV